MSKNKDFWGGVMLLVIGAGAVIIARDYHFGSVLHMGPGFFPTILGVILILFGLTIMIRGLIKGEQMRGFVSWRALILLSFSLIFFGILIERAGLIPALAALIFCSAYASREFKLLEVFLLIGVLILISVSLFIWGLGLPFTLIKSFWN
ncbi:MAG: tripartite tricarboxylate transporter TctB family protein [Thermodesulfobacteriota bacterium]